MDRGDAYEEIFESLREQGFRVPSKIDPALMESTILKMIGQYGNWRSAEQGESVETAERTDSNMMAQYSNAERVVRHGDTRQSGARGTLSLAEKGYEAGTASIFHPERGDDRIHALLFTITSGAATEVGQGSAFDL